MGGNKKERWRPVVGHKGYEVSDQGRIRSVDRTIVYYRKGVRINKRLTGVMLKPASCTTSDHLMVVLEYNFHMAVHRAVLEAFTGPCPDGQECRHANDVANDNRLVNLSWGTRSQNLYDAIRNGRKPVGERHYFAKLKNDDIPKIRKKLLRMNASDIAYEYKVSRRTIEQVRSGKSWRHIK